nr:hypothetical protein [Marinicella sp. W31]MDC2879091.1 hypothetical protein [Marinicella sp. W31]
MLMNAHLAKGGIVIAATHEPLGLSAARKYAFTGPERISADPFLAEDF